MNVNEYGLVGVSGRLEFGQNGLFLDGNPVNGYFSILLSDGVTFAKLKVGDGSADGDAVNLGQLNLKLDANKVVTDIDAAAGYIADAPTVKAAIAAQISALVGSAPEALNTLQEIASWVEDHQDLYDALLITIGNKLDASKVTTDINATAGNIPDAPTVKSYIDTQIGNITHDENCREVEFDYNSTFPLNIGALIPAGSRLDRIKIGITTAFTDFAAYASIGVDADNDIYMTAGEINLRSISISKIESIAPIGADTQVKLYLNKGTSTAGAGVVQIFFC